MSLTIRYWFIWILIVVSCGSCQTTGQKITENLGPSSHSVTEHRSRHQDFSQADLILLASTDYHVTMDQAEPFGSTLRGLSQLYQNKSLSLNAGDLFQGSVEGAVSKGKVIIDFFNMIPIDAVAMGNHDIDYGVLNSKHIIPQPGEDPRGNLKQRVKESRFPWLSVNVAYKKGMEPGSSPYRNALGRATIFAPHLIRNVHGIKVGIIGGTTVFTPMITVPQYVADLEFLPLKESVEAEAHYLRSVAHVDVVVFLAHAGLLCNNHVTPRQCHEEGQEAEMLRLFQALPRGLVDAAVGGHTHQMNPYEEINGVPVIQGSPFGKGLGVLALKKNQTQHWELMGYDHVDAALDPQINTQDITQAMVPYRALSTSFKKIKLGYLKAPFKADRFEEDPLANAVADALLEKSRPLKAQVSLINGGAIRHSLDTLTVSKNDVYTTLPFENHLTLVSMPGTTLRTILAIMLSSAHGLPGLSHLKIKAWKIDHPSEGTPGRDAFWKHDLNHDGQFEPWEYDFIQSVDVYNEKSHRYEPLDQNKIYRVATLDFLVSGGDHLKVVFDSIPQSKIRVDYSVTTRDAFEAFLKAHSDKGHPLDPDDFYTPSRRRMEWIPYSETLNKTSSMNFLNIREFSRFSII